MKGTELIHQERLEQVAKHGYTLDHDRETNDEFQLTDAASALTMNPPPGLEGAYVQSQGDNPPIGWNSEIWKKMVEKPYKERLIIAGALIAAEIDRIENQ